MIHTVYVLQSKRNNKRYVGYTRKSPAERLEEHNGGSNAWTKQNKPFDLVYYEEFSSARAARKQELYLKSAAGRSYLKKILGP